MKRAAYISGGTSISAAGTGIDVVWQQLVAGQRSLSALPCQAFEEWPWPQVFMVAEPSAAELGVDRKTHRTMEKQAALALRAASIAIKESTVLREREMSRVGLYLGLATVEDPSPSWSALQEMHANPTASLTAICSREMPPFFGLSQLNSSACAHIAGMFGMKGAMGGYSPFADAGLQALIEAALSIDEEDNDAALVGGVSQKINPSLLLQYEHLGWSKRETHLPGEGAAFLILDVKPSTGMRHVRLSGYSRGYSRNASSASAYERLLIRALEMACVDRGDIDWLLTNGESAGEQVALRSLFGESGVPLGCCRPSTGVLGSAEPLFNVLLAVHGMQYGKRLNFASLESPPKQEDVPLRHAVVTAEAPGGQYAVVVLSVEAA